eukprot:RCo018789
MTCAVDGCVCATGIATIITIARHRHCCSFRCSSEPHPSFFFLLSTSFSFLGCLLEAADAPLPFATVKVSFYLTFLVVSGAFVIPNMQRTGVGQRFRFVLPVVSR